MSVRRSKFFAGVLLLTAVVLMSCGDNKTTAGRLDVCDFGIVHGSAESSSENLRLINTLIRNAEDGSVIFFSEGIYYFDADISGGILVKNKKNITLEGQNAVFINTRYSPLSTEEKSEYNYSNIISISDSYNIRLRGISFDYINHTSISGVIIGYSDGDTYLKAFDEYLGGEKNPITGGEYVQSISTFTDSGVPLEEFWLSEKIRGVLGLAESENGIFRLKGFYGNTDELICARFTLGKYACPAALINNTDGFTVEECSVYSCPSAAVYALCGNSNFKFNGLSVKSKKQALFASNEDCIHIKGLRGTLEISDCVFEGIGDDALNVHSRAGKVLSISKKSCFVKDALTGKTVDRSWAEKGDIIEFFDISLNSLGKSRVISVKNGAISFDEIPNGAVNGSIVQNTSYSPDVTIRNCIVKRGRARAFLIQSERAEIEGCVIENMGLSAILAAPDISTWYEMGPTDSISIKNNIFRGCCSMQRSSYAGDVTVSLNHDAHIVGDSISVVHGDILIENNTFENSFMKPIYVRASKHIKENNNIFINCADTNDIK